ncbi:polysaccharide biosynthesis protein [Gemella bergeri ATCC 700627]|uniref:Polysaccharide biosynthesis protein n=1 Tax=Gemella bergeri ATCC 700627 TaxID=1321820 RepID=U2QCW4_9BACL|nr:polysaccharide biosynthesis protein [Gemella bergeri]ERK60705.1 polysaccharide biosynthesis protein [Gemella bergeri ATCC 700627]
MENLKKDSLFKGTALLSISLLLTKILGAVYLIPFYQIIGGEEQMALFNYGYSYYVTILEISSAGTPLAIAKLVAKYNALGAYDVSKRIVKLGSILLIIMGVIGFSVLFFGSGYISEQILISSQQKFTPTDGALVLKSLSFAIPIVLVSAGVRGLFQGHEIMLPSAISQFIEQVMRIVFMLVATYIVIKILNQGIVIGNVAATFSATIGAIFSVLTLVYFYKKYSGGLEYNTKTNLVELNISTKDLVKEFFSVSIPFIFIVGLFPILNIIDQHNFIHGMTILGKADIVDGRFSALQLVNKVVMIAVAIAPAFSSTFLPSITRLYAKGEKEGVSNQINKVILSLMMIVLPALVGMYILADPLYATFYSRSIINAELLRFYLPLAVLFSLYSLTSVIMQAVNRQVINLVTIAVGFAVKYFTITPFVIRFETNGVILSSISTYVVMILINVVVINLEVRLKAKEFVGKFLILICSCFIMFIVVAAVYSAIIQNFTLESKLSSMILMVICAVIGASTYFYCVTKMKFVKYLFGKNISLKSLRRIR